MKRIVALGIIALTIAVNTAPMKVEAAGVNACSQYLGGTNAITISNSCNLKELTGGLQNLQLNGNCIKLGSIADIGNCAAKLEQNGCSTNAKAVLPANSGSTQSCKANVAANCANIQNYNTKVSENKVSTEEASTEEVSTKEVSTKEVSTKEVSTKEVSTKEVNT